MHTPTSPTRSRTGSPARRRSRRRRRTNGIVGWRRRSPGLHSSPRRRPTPTRRPARPQRRRRGYRIAVRRSARRHRLDPSVRPDAIRSPCRGPQPSRTPRHPRSGGGCPARASDLRRHRRHRSAGGRACRPSRPSSPRSSRTMARPREGDRRCRRPRRHCRRAPRASIRVTRCRAASGARKRPAARTAPDGGAYRAWL